MNNKTLPCMQCGLNFRPNNFKKHSIKCTGVKSLSWHVRKARDLTVNQKNNKKDVDWDMIQRLYDEGSSVKELCDRFPGVTFTAVSNRIKAGLFRIRTRHETMSLRGTYRSCLIEDDSIRWRRKTYKVIDSYGIEVLLDSKLETRFAEICQRLNIKWQKAQRFILSDRRSYTPDFFLPDHNLFVDPKAKFWIKNFKSKQLDKIKLFEEENKTTCLILWDSEIKRWEDILLSMVGPVGVEPTLNRL